MTKVPNQSRQFNINVEVEDGLVVLSVSSRIYLTADAAAMLSEHLSGGKLIDDPCLPMLIEGLTGKNAGNIFAISNKLLQASEIISSGRQR